MMKRYVYKYMFPLDDSFELALPRGAELLHFDNQCEMPTLWCLVEQGVAPDIRKFRLAGTGHAVEGNVSHVGSALFRGGAIVFHLFEVLP